jgi:phage terminase large subunit
MAIISFKNNPLQGEFVFNPYRKSAYVGAIRAGKTVALVARVLWLCDKMPGSRFLVGRKRFTDLYNTTLKELFRIVAERNGGSYENPGPYVKKWDGQFHDLYLQSGSVIHCRHVDNIQNVLGVEISGYALDQAEEIDEEVFYHIDSRLSYWNEGRREAFKEKHGFYPKNFAMLLANPDPGWIKGLLIDSEKHDWKVYETDIEHNRANLGPDYIESLYRTHPKDWCDRFLKGSWDIRGGQVYKEFNEEIHAVDPCEIPAHWPRFLAIDWGITHRAVCLWGAVDEAGAVWIYKELSVTEHLVSQFAAKIFEMSAGDAVPRDETDKGILVWIDPATNQHHGVVDRTVKEEFALNKIYGTNANNSVDAGINKVAERLHVNPVTGKPLLYIFRTCKWLIRSMKLYTWQPVNLQGVSSGKPIKKDDDEADCLRYLLMAVQEMTSDKAPPKKAQMSDYDAQILAQMMKSPFADQEGEVW